MIKNCLLVLTLVLCLLCVGCHQDETSYDTNAEVSLSFGDSVQIVRLQGTITLQNINTRQTHATSNLGKGTTHFTLTKGAYSLMGEGTVLYRNEKGEEKVRYFRTAQNYLEIVDNPTQIQTPIIWL